MSTTQSKGAKAPGETLIDGFEAQGWNPEPGDELTGKVLGISAGYSDYTQASYPILRIAVESERNLTAPDDVTRHDPPVEKSVHAFQAVLRNELMAQRPEPGESITIACGGKRAHRRAAGQTVMVYRVQVHREGVQAGAWDDLFGPPPGRRVGQSVDPATGELTSFDVSGADHPLG